MVGNRKMKICTITCHDVYNHGASLQAYALMKYLSSKGNNVEIIDYKPDYLDIQYKLLAINNERWNKNIFTKLVYLLFKIPNRILQLKRKRSFDKFTNKYLKLTPKKYVSNEQLKNDIPEADIYMCGSDQIWNSSHKNGRDEAFYLNFVPNNKIRASYAASFATDSIANEYKDMVKKQVNRLDRISVREQSGVNILNELGVKNVVTVLDPVFLLSKKEWDLIDKQVFEEEYILIYDFDNNPLIKKIAIDISRKMGWKIYSVNEMKLGYEDKSFKYSGPEIFVSLIKYSKLVISNSFHAVVFSIIYEKQITVVNRLENNNTRMRDLLNIVGLESRMIHNDFDINEIITEIDYSHVNKILKEKIEFSKAYLENVLTINTGGDRSDEEKGYICDRLTE